MRNKLACMLLLASPTLLSMECSNDTASSLSDSWIIGTTITAIAISAVQVVGASATFIADYIFYKKSESDEVIKLKAELDELRKQHAQMKLDEPKIILLIFEEINNYIKTVRTHPRDNTMIQLIKDLKAMLLIQAQDENPLMEVVESR